MSREDAEYVRDEIHAERVAIAKWRRDACAHCKADTYENGSPTCEPENGFGTGQRACDVYDSIRASRRRIADFLGY
jgi:hypothetical protein